MYLGHISTYLYNEYQEGRCAPRDVLHGYYHGIIYLKTVIKFHGTRVNIIALMPIRNVRPSLSRFYRNAHHHCF